MAYCCTVYQSIAVKNQGRASCTCLRRRRIRRQQLNRLFPAGCPTWDRKVKNSILRCTAVGNSCFRSRLPRCYRSNTDGCCGTCPAGGACHTGRAGWASRPSNAGCSGRTAGACRAGRGDVIRKVAITLENQGKIKKNKIYHITQCAVRADNRAAFLRGGTGRRR